MKDYILKLNLKSIILFEKTYKKSFYDLEESDYSKLLYCMFRANNDFLHTYEVFTTMLQNKRFAMQAFGELEKILELMPKEDFETKDASIEEEESHPFVSEFAAKLIVNVGVNADYVFEKMELWQMKDLFQAFEEKEKNRLTEDRLWAFLQMSPWLDSKKKVTPEKLLPFTWEKENQEKAVQSDFKAHEDIIRGVLGLRKKSAEKEALKDKE